MIVQNAGEESSVVVAAVLAGKGNYGYNAANGTYGDMSARRKAIWIVASLLVGLSAIPSLMLLQPRPPRPLRAPHIAAAPAAA